MTVDTLEVGLVIKTKIDMGITLWQAIKLRIAGKAYMPIAEAIGKEAVALIRKAAEDAKIQ